MPEAFSGEPGERDWDAYEQYFIQCAELNGWDADRRAQFLGVGLRGQAERFAATLEPATRQDWDQFARALRRRFAPGNREALHKASFRSRRQRSGESFAGLADDLRRLVALAYPLAAHALRMELARDQFVDSVSDVRLQLRLKENMPATLDDAVARAVQLEALWATHPSINQRPEFEVPKPSEGDPASVLAMAPRLNPVSSSSPSVLAQSLAQLSLVADRLEDTTGKLSRAAENLQRASASSLYGRTTDSSPSPRQRPPNHNFAPRGPPRCWDCGMLGHTRRFCPSGQPGNFQ